jgi:putative transcriptional regulator
MAMLRLRCNKAAGWLGNSMVIHWRLAVVMAERNISNKELAQLTGMHPRSVSRLKTRRQFTRIDEETLNALCEALQCQPGDLMVFEKDS